jgi:simple sugar transport system permease protein
MILSYYTLIILLLAGTIRVATPLVLATYAGLFSERSGVVALGLEGMMLGAAFASAASSAIYGSAWIGLLIGVSTSVLIAGLLSFVCVFKQGNQVVAAIAINLTIAGLAPTLALAWFDLGNQTPSLVNPGQRFLELSLPWSSSARLHPFPGLLYSELISGHSFIVYLAATLVPLSAFILYKTRFGLRIRAVGENPYAVDTAGISVKKIRTQAVLISGVLCGVAGTYLATAAGAGFIPDMTAGKGYLALAALIFGNWRPYRALGACLLFACTDSIATRLQGVSLPMLGVIPVQFIIALPYILTVVLLAGFVARSNPPKAIGIPYDK